MIKKVFKLLTMLCILSPIYCVCFGLPGGDNGEEEKAYEFPYDPQYQVDPTTELQDKVDIGKENQEKSIMIRLLEVFGLDTNAFDGDHKFLNYVRAILNIALGLLSMAALIMIIYTFYLMFFTDNDAGIKKAKGNLVGIFVALVIIGISWLIVSFIFRWYQDNWKKNEDKISGNTAINYELNNNNQIYLTI